MEEEEEEDFISTAIAGPGDRRGAAALGEHGGRAGGCCLPWAIPNLPPGTVSSGFNRREKIKGLLEAAELSAPLPSPVRS